MRCTSQLIDMIWYLYKCQIAAHHGPLFIGIIHLAGVGLRKHGNMENHWHGITLMMKRRCKVLLFPLPCLLAEETQYVCF